MKERRVRVDSLPPHQLRINTRLEEWFERKSVWTICMTNCLRSQHLKAKKTTLLPITSSILTYSTFRQEARWRRWSHMRKRWSESLHESVELAAHDVLDRSVVLNSLDDFDVSLNRSWPRCMSEYDTSMNSREYKASPTIHLRRREAEVSVQEETSTFSSEVEPKSDSSAQTQKMHEKQTRSNFPSIIEWWSVIIRVLWGFQVYLEVLDL